MTYSSEGPDHDRWAEVPPAPASPDGSPASPEPGSDPATPGFGADIPGSGSGPSRLGFPAGVPYRRRRFASPAVAALLVVGAAAVSVGAGHYLWPAASADRTASAAGSAGAPRSPSPVASGSAANVSALAAEVDPGLVDVNTTFGYQNAVGAGTGIVLTSNGEVLTNNHVINGATSVNVTDVGNGETYKATVVGYDRAADIAVLQLHGASGLRTSRIGNSDALTVGQEVVAFGNAGGTGGTPSSAGGSITALGQAITASDELDGTSEQLSGLIETNADIQSGDSGGTLVDSSGLVIGMDTAAASGYSLQSEANQGYAIPIDTAVSIARKIESGQSSPTIHVGPTALLGVTTSSGGPGGGFDGGFADGYGTAVAGATVNGVVSGGPASEAGIAAGDTITSVDGRSISSPAALGAAIGQDRPGQSVQLTWTDSSGQAHSATVNLGSGPPAWRVSSAGGQVRSNTETTSTWNVWGNRSTKRTEARRYPAPVRSPASRPRLPASQLMSTTRPAPLAATTATPSGPSPSLLGSATTRSVPAGRHRVTSPRCTETGRPSRFRRASATAEVDPSTAVTDHP